MKQKVRVSKGRKVSQSVDSSLLKRMTKLQKLRERVRLAEVATKTKHDASHTRRP
jgi:hypothetical protein